MTPTRPTKRYWGTQRVARVLQVTPATVAAWIDQGHLKGHKTPTGRRRVASADLVEFLRAHQMAVPPDLAPVQERDVVVVVEDDASYLKALARWLAREAPEVEVVETMTAMDGLLEIGRLHPALVVLDYRLPDLNAVQVVERLLDPSRRLTADVMVVTAGMPMEAEAELRRVGVRSILNKAEGMPEVVQAIRRALQERKRGALDADARESVRRAG
ncbi:MAG TPA: response regulator [Gemmatimonadales bacterium]|nr:response regulator [Gemmatimonadales bacterium]